MTVLIVTGTGTGVGKTVVTAAIAALGIERGSRVAVVKPGQTGVAPGEPGDIDAVRRLAPDIDGFELSRYPAALAPAAAARSVGRKPYSLLAAAQEIQALAETHRLVVVEGAGGLLVRFDAEGTTIAALAHWLDAPCVLVADPGLGTLNHTALTLEVMAHRGVELAGVVLGSWPTDPRAIDPAMRSNIEDLETLSARPLSGAMAAHSGALDPAGFLDTARRGLGPELGGHFNAADFREQARA